MKFIILSHVSYVLLGLGNKLKIMKFFFREGDNEDEFYNGKLKKVCNFYFVKPIRFLFWFAANDLEFYCRMNS
jgi:hypothetical protein